MRFLAPFVETNANEEVRFPNEVWNRREEVRRRVSLLSGTWAASIGLAEERNPAGAAEKSS
jgi:hypothetical protein